MGAFLNRIFGRDNAEPRPNLNQQTRQGPSQVSQQDNAVLDLKLQRNSLIKYQNKIKVQLEKEREFAKKLLRENKRDKAKLLLKKKRYLEGLLEKTDDQLSNLETMVQNIEYAQIELKVVDGLKAGNEALKELHKICSFEDVEQLMSDTQDAIEYQREIDDLLGQRLTQDDEDAILAELDAITASEVELPEVPIESRLPEVPIGQPSEYAATERVEKRQAVAT